MICKDSEIIQEIIKRARTDKSINSIDGFMPGKKTVDGKEIIPFIRNLLAKIGVKLQSCGQALDENMIKQRWYCLDTDEYFHPYRVETLAALNRHFTFWVNHDYKEPNWNPGQPQNTKGDDDSLEFTENLVLSDNPEIAEKQMEELSDSLSYNTPRLKPLAEYLKWYGELPKDYVSKLSGDALGITCLAIDKYNARELEHEKQREVLANF